ncbi:alpha/beta fold hydrolase [Flagellimonas zhangzhouensis]|uniref:Pimeloyl-ACP methyl ester carboxylesterase n=1 Tax=Flagellimonas zhangzhouensis TaxID=1073328 RepID=A0A1H2Z920_9FLAO|nr:alpha/beta hydrolase [Allomuricauda zhangzhouensis]SDR07481.1 Pimeloyl-ACP methyl ester carboxylesterase [Allomuricauda zhangzhouensis]SDX13269.1 Pimeloyl-ACP methyl ester carboxylesterase [Allomuricauda zhangzhouensis]
MPALKFIQKSLKWTLSAILALTFTQNSMGQDIASKKIHLPDQKLEIHYLQAGQGKTKWVLIHGLGSYSKAYNKILSNLPEHVEAYALDLPGFGETALNGTTISMENYASVVDEFIKELDLQHVVLAGHSMGGQVAMTAAINQPKWLKSLILFAPAGIEQFTAKDHAWFEAVATESLYLNLTDEQIRQNFNVNFYGMQLPQDAEFMYQDRIKIKKDSEGYKTYCSTTVASIKAMLSGPVYDQIGQIKVPTLVLFGKNDLLIPNKILHPDLTIAQLMETLQNDYPTTTNKLLDEAGHFIIWDQSEKVVEEIQNFTDAHK